MLEVPDAGEKERGAIWETKHETFGFGEEDGRPMERIRLWHRLRNALAHVCAGGDYVDGAGAVSILGAETQVDLEWMDFGSDTLDNLEWDLWTQTEGAFYGMGPDSVVPCDPECAGLW